MKCRNPVNECSSCSFLSDAERTSLEALSHKRTASQVLAKRAMSCPACRTSSACRRDPGRGPDQLVAEPIREWQVRFMERRLDGLGHTAARSGTEDRRRAGGSAGHADADREGPQAGPPLVDPVDGCGERPPHSRRCRGSGRYPGVGRIDQGREHPSERSPLLKLRLRPCPHNWQFGPASQSAPTTWPAARIRRSVSVRMR